PADRSGSAGSRSLNARGPKGSAQAVSRARFPMTILVVAEKPSVARDIAHVLGARSRHEGYFQGDAHLVTWAVGRLVALAEPGEMKPAWKTWRLGDLPLLPHAWPLVVAESTRAQFETVPVG